MMVAVRSVVPGFAAKVTVTLPFLLPVVGASTVAQDTSLDAVHVVSEWMVTVTVLPAAGWLVTGSIVGVVGTGGAGAAQGAGARFSVVVAQSEPPIMARHAVAMIQGVIFFIICYCLDVIRAF